MDEKIIEKYREVVESFESARLKSEEFDTLTENLDEDALIKIIPPDLIKRGCDFNDWYKE